MREGRKQQRSALRSSGIPFFFQKNTPSQPFQHYSMLLVEQGPIRSYLLRLQEVKDLRLPIDQTRVVNPDANVPNVLSPEVSFGEEGTSASFEERDEDGGLGGARGSDFSDVFDVSIPKTNEQKGRKEGGERVSSSFPFPLPSAHPPSRSAFNLKLTSRTHPTDHSPSHLPSQLLRRVPTSFSPRKGRVPVRTLPELP